MEQQIKVEAALTDAIKQLDKGLLRKAKVIVLVLKFRVHVCLCNRLVEPAWFRLVILNDQPN